MRWLAAAAPQGVQCTCGAALHRVAPRGRRLAAPPRAGSFLTPLGGPLCELPHAHDTHVAVAVAATRVRLAQGRALTLVAPTDAAAVETMHALLGEEARRAAQAPRCFSREERLMARAALRRLTPSGLRCGPPPSPWPTSCSPAPRWWPAHQASPSCLLLLVLALPCE
jgi:hypothetical protein